MSEFNFEFLNRLALKMREKSVKPLGECVYVIPRPIYDALVEAGELPKNAFPEEYKKETE